MLLPAEESIVTKIPEEVQVAGIPRPVAYRRTLWGKDPFARCSYSALQKGANPEDRQILRAPISDRVFFAGEHVADDFPMTVHGALITGREAATQVLETSARRIAVIGAGVSGLGAARVLTDAGREVTVFEARNRIGGRVWTDMSLGLPLDMGGSWIHGPKGNPLTELADAQNVARVKTKYTKFYVRTPDGQKLPKKQLPAWVWEAFEVDQNYGMTRAKLSVDAFEEGEDLPGTDVVFPEGYHQILPALSEGYRIELNSIVRLVDWSQKAVSLETNDERATFDAVVVTLPIGVLKSGDVQFKPPLPVEKERALDRLGLALLNKLYLKFDEAFWEQDKPWIMLGSETPRPFSSWLNFKVINGAPVLCVFQGADQAWDWEEKSDAEALQAALQTLAGMYKNGGADAGA